MNNSYLTKEQQHLANLSDEAFNLGLKLVKMLQDLPDTSSYDLDTFALVLPLRKKLNRLIDKSIAREIRRAKKFAQSVDNSNHQVTQIAA